MPKNNEEQELSKTIEFFRKELIHVGIVEGFTCEKVIALSQKLDLYIAKYQMIKSKE